MNVRQTEPLSYRTVDGVRRITEQELAQKSGLDLESIVYFNGDFIPLNEAKLNIATQAFQYGTNGFEGICGFWNNDENQIYIFRLEDHFRRFANTAEFLGIDLTTSIKELCDITCEMVRRNKPNSDMYIRPNIYKAGFSAVPTLIDIDGENPAGFSVFGRLIKTRPDIEKGLHVMVSKWNKPSNAMVPAWAKIGGSYVMSSHVSSGATKAGFDDAVLLNIKGNVTEASTTNIFILKDNTLITPPVTDSILNGITRDSIIKIAKRELNLKTIEKSFGREALYSADEVFITGTLAGARPITKIDNQSIGTGKTGTVTRKLFKFYFDIASGKNLAYKKWCTPVF